MTVQGFELSDRYPLTLVQTNLLWLYNAKIIEADFENLASTRRIQGPLDISALMQGFRTLFQRQDVLRTRLQTAEDGQTYQTIGEVDPPIVHYDVSHAGSAAPERAQEINAAVTWKKFERDRELFRFFIVTLAPLDHVVGIVSSHLVTDFLSHNIMWRELSALYSHARGTGAAPIEHVKRFRDYVKEKAEWEAGQEVAKDTAFWSTQINSLVAPAKIASQPFSMQSVRTSSAQKQELVQFAMRERVTMFMLLLLIYTAIFLRESTKEKLYTKIVRDERARAEYSGLVGNFAIGCPMMIDVSGNPTLRELLARIRRASIDLILRPWIPFYSVAMRPIDVPIIDYVEADSAESCDMGDLGGQRFEAPASPVVSGFISGVFISNQADTISVDFRVSKEGHFRDIPQRFLRAVEHVTSSADRTIEEFCRLIETDECRLVVND